MYTTENLLRNANVGNLNAFHVIDKREAHSNKRQSYINAWLLGFVSHQNSIEYPFACSEENGAL